MCGSSDSRRAALSKQLKRRIAGIEVVLNVAGRAVISRELREVVALEGFGELVEELDELGGRLI